MAKSFSLKNVKHLFLITHDMDPSRNIVGSYPINYEAVVFDDKQSAVDYFYQKVAEYGFTIERESEYNNLLFYFAVGVWEYGEKASMEIKSLLKESDGEFGM